MLTIYLPSKMKQTKNVYKHDINQILLFIINANLSFYYIKISGRTQANDGFQNSLFFLNVTLKSMVLILVSGSSNT